MIVVVADETELEGAEQIIGAALRDETFRAGGLAVFRCHVPESRGGSVEVDALVCTPQSVTIVEVKGFTARQEGTLATPPNGPWTIDGEPAALYHAVRVPNPFVQVRRQVFAAKSLLQQSGIFGWVNAVIALVSQPGAEITIEETRIADGYRAVLVDRDDASALHDYFQAESGRTVRLSIDDVTRVLAALNLGHLLPTPDELTAQGFPATLDSATTARPTAPTAVELGTTAGATGSATPARSTGSPAAATPAFLAAIDRLAHRSSPSAHTEESAAPIPDEEVVEPPAASTAFTDTPAEDAATVTTGARSLGESGPEFPRTDVAEDVPSQGIPPDSLASDNATLPPETSDQLSPTPAAPDEPLLTEEEPDRHHENGTAASALEEDDVDEQQPSAGDDTDRPPTDEATDPGETAPHSEHLVSLSKSPAQAGTAAGPAADDLDDEPRMSAVPSTSSHEPAPADDEPPAAATYGGTGSTSATPSSAHTAVPAYRSPEPEEPRSNSHHWSDWVEADQTVRRPTLRERWRAWRRGDGPSLIERWHNRPVRERTTTRRRLRVGPGIALLLFIGLFGAGFFAITAVQASRFEMSDYDRMCGEDKKAFPDAAPYQRDGARPIYLSGELTTMVDPADPAAWNPHDPSTVQLIACMKQLELRDLVQTCQYGPSPGTPIGRTVNLFRATYEVSVYELHTGREVAKATMLGERYSADPSNTDPDRCRAAADAPDYLGRRLGQPSTAQLSGFLAPLVHADRTTP